MMYYVVRLDCFLFLLLFLVTVDETNKSLKKKEKLHLLWYCLRFALKYREKMKGDIKGVIFFLKLSLQISNYE